MCVPIFNDWENAALLIENFHQSQHEDTSLMVIDNGSHKTHELVVSRINELENVTILQISTNQGFGGAIQEASKASKAEWLLWMPGNMKVLPSELSAFISILKSCHPETFVKAHRVFRPATDRLKTLFASILQTIASGKVLFDTGGTPSALHRTSILWDEIGLAPKDYTFDSYMLFAAKRLKLRVERPKVPYHQRLIGRSHWQSGFTAEVWLMTSLIRSIIRWRLDAFRKGRGQ